MTDKQVSVIAVKVFYCLCTAGVGIFGYQLGGPIGMLILGIPWFLGVVMGSVLCDVRDLPE